MMERRGIQRQKLGERKVTRRREGARMTGAWGVGVFCRACKDQSFLFLYGVVPDLERTNWVGGCGTPYIFRACFNRPSRHEYTGMHAAYITSNIEGSTHNIK